MKFFKVSSAQAGQFSFENTSLADTLKITSDKYMQWNYGFSFLKFPRNNKISRKDSLENMSVQNLDQ